MISIDFKKIMINYNEISDMKEQGETMWKTHCTGGWNSAKCIGGGILLVILCAILGCYIASCFCSCIFKELLCLPCTLLKCLCCIIEEAVHDSDSGAL